MTDHRRDIDSAIADAERRGRRRWRSRGANAGRVAGRAAGQALGQILGLILVCLIVGWLLTRFGVDPREFWAGMFERLGRAVTELRQNFGQVFFYIFYGAIIVVPVWILVRIVKALR